MPKLGLLFVVITVVLWDNCDVEILNCESNLLVKLTNKMRTRSA